MPAKQKPLGWDDLDFDPIITREEINAIREAGEMLYEPVEDATLQVNVPLEYFYGTDSHGDYVALVLSGSATSPFKGDVILLDPQVWQDLKKWRWCVKIRNRCDVLHITIYAKITLPTGKTDHVLTTHVGGLLFQQSQRLTTFRHPMDYRKSGLCLTTSKLKNNPGRVGVSLIRGRYIARDMFADEKKRIATCTTSAEAQQIYNAVLLRWKQNNPLDLRLFGRVFEKGILQPMFPADHYDGKVLKQPFADVFNDHRHLVMPVSDSETLEEIKQAGTDIESVISPCVPEGDMDAIGLVDHHFEREVYKPAIVPWGTLGLDLPLKDGVLIPAVDDDPYVAITFKAHVDQTEDLAFLVDPQIAERLQSDSWRLRMSLLPSSVQIIMSITQDYETILITVKAEVAKVYGIEKKLYTLNNPFDYRLKNLTMTNIANLIGNGWVLVDRKDKPSSLNPYVARFVNSNGDYIYSVHPTAIDAQQRYNELLIREKVKTPKDLRCFGRVFVKGVLQPMFPPYMYGDDGKLLPEYKAVFDKHQHLVAPVTDETILTEMKAVGTDVNFVC